MAPQLTHSRPSAKSSNKSDDKEEMKIIQPFSLISASFRFRLFSLYMDMQVFVRAFLEWESKKTKQD